MLKRAKRRRELLERIAKSNKRKCAMRPLYGADLCQAVDIFSDKNVTKNEDQARQDIFVSYQFNVNGVRENITISLWICILFLRTVIVIFGVFFQVEGYGSCDVSICASSAQQKPSQCILEIHRTFE